ncbi:diphosphomevalonate decarboxylase [Candidatus Peregrinibacteria bacterium CG10_big_fil_rev_8_21_14_0_10_49_10]|nr:MAG: diphosphomevalonate decarboxylase [Candidatus Peregrinibacteria bacterium CG10_big_fil_rev_8_21_14_0_10_49_10]
MSATAISTPNIALIKYWGNRSNELRLPAADSLSMTLNTPTVEITVDYAEDLIIRSYESDGAEREMTEKHMARFAKHLELTRQYLTQIGAEDAIPASVQLTIRSGIPPGVGLASSAAVFSAVAKAYVGLIASSIILTDEQTSVIARLGSGSAARSIFGGFVTLENTGRNGMDGAVAKQVASEDHWLLHDIVIIPSYDEKKVGSTEGHAIAQTSPHFMERIEAIGSYRQKDCIDAILAKDFEKLQKVAEEDSLNMHHVMETSSPPLQYLTQDTHRIVDAVTRLREEGHLPVLYTMDAGPTVHLLCTDEARMQIVDFAHAQEGCTIFEASVGSGSKIIQK